MPAEQTRERVAFPKSELPTGAKRVVTVMRREIVVINSPNGKLYAVFNRCPHHQAPMHRGTVTGLTVPPGDPVALAGALSSLLEDAPLRARLGAAGKTRARTQFAVEPMVKGIQALYRSVGQGKDRTRRAS